jgi:hypothetical protein
MHRVTLGTISHGTMRPEDLIPTFADELERIARGDAQQMKACAPLIAEARAIDWNAQQGMNDDPCCEVLADLEDALNGFAPDYCYFGAHPGDGADFGFWLSEDWEQQARDDGVLFVDDLSEVPDDYQGMVAYVNDHGNATLYAYDGTNHAIGKHAPREVWSVV